MTKKDNIIKEDYKENNNSSSKELLIVSILESGKEKFVNSLMQLQGVHYVNSYIELLKMSKTETLDIDHIIQHIEKVKFI